MIIPCPRRGRSLRKCLGGDTHVRPTAAVHALLPFDDVARVAGKRHRPRRSAIANRRRATAHRAGNRRGVHRNHIRRGENRIASAASHLRPIVPCPNRGRRLRECGSGAADIRPLAAVQLLLPFQDASDIAAERHRAGRTAITKRRRAARNRAGNRRWRNRDGQAALVGVAAAVVSDYANIPAGRPEIDRNRAGRAPADDGRARRNRP